MQDSASDSSCLEDENPDRERSRLDAFPARVAILLCTCQGQRYLAEQLDSIAAQSYPDWVLHVSDDGSMDGTKVILEKYRKDWGDERLLIHSGPAAGFAANFLSLTCAAAIQADYYAYCDQDDIWEPEKLQRAVAWLSGVPVSVPALYCSRTRLVNEEGEPLGYSPLFTRLPGFGNALVQNIAGGNTMVFNDAARSLLREFGENVDVVTHDWWAYMVISGCGGQIHYDAYPSLGYRQHGENLVGSNSGWASRWRRMRLMLKGRQKSWNDRHIQALHGLQARLTPENRRIFEAFSAARNRWLIPRVNGIMRSGIYRQTAMGTLGLIVAALFRKI